MTRYKNIDCDGEVQTAKNQARQRPLLKFMGVLITLMGLPFVTAAVRASELTFAQGNAVFGINLMCIGVGMSMLIRGSRYELACIRLSLIGVIFTLVSSWVIR